MIWDLILILKNGRLLIALALLDGKDAEMFGPFSMEIGRQEIAEELVRRGIFETEGEASTAVDAMHSRHLRRGANLAGQDYPMAMGVN